jgi:hypothetical protein
VTEAVGDFADEHYIPAPRRWIRQLLHRLFRKRLFSEPGSGPKSPPDR